MAKKEYALEVEGDVTDAFTKANRKEHIVIAQVTGKIRKHFIRIVSSD